MKPGLLSFLLVSAASIGAAQDIGVLNQKFQLRYENWRFNQDQTNSTTRAIYDFTVGLPVVSYRLGAVALTGSMEYNRISTGEGASSDLGLNRYGVKAFLFPYRPFHLNLDYSHSQSPALLGADLVKGDVFGANLIHRGRKVKDLHITFRHGTRSELGETETWNLWTITENQHFGKTMASFHFVHSEFDGGGGGAGFKDTYLAADTDTILSKAWKFRSSLSTDDTGDSRSIEASADLSGSLGRWLTLSSLGLNQVDSGAGAAKTMHLAESISYSKDRVTTFGAVAMTTQSRPNDVNVLIGGSEAGASSKIATLSMGGAYAFAKEWHVVSDLGLSLGGGLQAGAGTTRDTTSFHAGIMRGGDVPALIKHSLFYLSDRAFERRIQNDYPPDYVPGDLAAEKLRHRLRQNGNLGFTADLWHIQAKGGPGKLDWARVTGDLKVGGNLQFLTIADWKQDGGLTDSGVKTQNKALSLSGSYQLGRSSLSGSAGYYWNTKRAEVLGGSGSLGNPAASTLDGSNDGAGTFYSAGFRSRLGKMPYGVLWTRYDAGHNQPTTAISTYATLDFRSISFRVTFQAARRADGLRDRRVTVDLLRFFGSIALWGPKW